MKILAGAVRPDAGEVRVDGEAVDARLARRTPGSVGIGIVYQELSLFPERSILANLFVDDQPTRFGLVDTRRDARDAPARSSPASASTSTRDAPVGGLGIGERQLVELSRVLHRAAAAC